MFVDFLYFLIYMNKFLFLICIFALIILIKMNIVENMTDLNSEAVQNIASVYNKDNLQVTSLTVTDKVIGGLKLDSMTFRTMSGNDITTDGAITSKYKLVTPVVETNLVKLGGNNLTNDSDGWTRYRKPNGSYANFAANDVWVDGKLLKATPINQTSAIGGGGGNDYKLICPDGQQVVGIYGGAGGYIDRIGLLCK